MLASLFFLPIVLFMGFELSLELIRSVRLAAELEAKTAALRGSEQKLAFAAEAALFLYGVSLLGFEPKS